MSGACFYRDAEYTSGLAGENSSQAVHAFRTFRTFACTQAGPPGIFPNLSPTVTLHYRNSPITISKALVRRQPVSFYQTFSLMTRPRPMRHIPAPATRRPRPITCERSKLKCRRTTSGKDTGPRLHHDFRVLPHEIGRLGPRPGGVCSSLAMSQRSPLRESAVIKRLRREVAPQE